VEVVVTATEEDKRVAAVGRVEATIMTRDVNDIEQED